MFLEWIYDTIWEFWQYLKPKGKVYLAAKYHDKKLMLLRMIPEGIELPEGYEQMTQVMSRAEASKRIMNFPLYRVVESKKSSEIGT